MTAVLEACGLGKRYGRRWALQDCTMSIPPGKVVGLVGPNGAGKTTLLHLAVGLLAPTLGTVRALGGVPGHGSGQLARVGFVAQETPVYPRLSVAQHLRMGAWLNPNWDGPFAARRVEELGLGARQRAGSLSGGQRAQHALTLATAKRPEVLILDEPVASLDPLARREFLQSLMEVVARQEVSVVLSSHLIADLERVCDYLVVLVASRVRLAGEVDSLLASHHRLSGPRRDAASLPGGQEVIEESHTDRQSTLLVAAVVLVLSGPHLAHLYHVDVSSCRGQGDCSSVISTFLRTDRPVQELVNALAMVTPGIVGVFWGAPLVARELESGTYRLAWSQSVTRARWLTAKLGVVGLAGMLTAGLFSLAATWWSSPLDRANMTRYVSFDQRDIVPVGYAALAFVLGVAIGVVVRRAIPAMAASLAGFVFVRLSFAHWARPYLVKPLRLVLAMDSSNQGCCDGRSWHAAKGAGRAG